MSSTHRNFFQYLLSNSTVYDLVLSCFSPAQLCRLRLACKLANEAARSFVRRAYDINRHLKHFFDDPLAFRHLQAETGALISGSNALQFLDRTFYPKADLDIYVDVRYCEQLVKYLTLREGYVFRPREDGDIRKRQQSTVGACLASAFWVANESTPESYGRWQAELDVDFDDGDCLFARSLLGTQFY